MKETEGLKMLLKELEKILKIGISLTWLNGHSISHW